MTQRWTLAQIPWDRFDAARVSPDLLALAKAAAMVEANAADYVAYLRNVFHDDPAFLEVVDQWGAEERLHGEALGRWAERADPSFSFEAALADFQRLYKIDVETAQSVRGSRAGELVARQVVESGTSSFYSAIRDAAEEPALAWIASRIAEDEYFHYRLFARHFARYQAVAPLSAWARLKVAVSRFNEAEDDELGYAYFAANVMQKNRAAGYHSGAWATEYWKRATRLYRRGHVDNIVRMVLRAADLKPNGWLFRLAAGAFWRVIRWRTAALGKAA